MGRLTSDNGSYCFSAGEKKEISIKVLDYLHECHDRLYEIENALEKGKTNVTVVEETGECYISILGEEYKADCEIL